jgi:hypothetical protein
VTCKNFRKQVKMSFKSKPTIGIPPLISGGCAVICVFIGLTNFRSSWVNGDVGGVAIGAFFIGMGLLWLLAFVFEIHLLKMSYRQLLRAAVGVIGFMLLLLIAFFVMGRQARPSRAILEAMAGVCQGQAETRAAAYTPGPGVHKLVLLDSSGQPNPWTGALPRAWRPASLEAAELVLCVGEERTEIIQTCHYSGGPDIDRRHYVRDVALLEARTGALVRKATLSGESPRRCQEFEIVKMTSLGGLPVSVEDVVEWLQADVESGQ